MYIQEYKCFFSYSSPFQKDNLMRTPGTPPMTTQRFSGILAHISSLPSSYGIGDIGTSAYAFIDFLVNAEQKYWQFLPIGPTNALFGHSPYMSSSAFAGSPLLISPELLHRDGFVDYATIAEQLPVSSYFTEFKKVTEYKYAVLQTAYRVFKEQNINGTTAYKDFLQAADWLDDYSIFMTAKKKYNQLSWLDWPEPIRCRDKNNLKSFAEQNREHIDYFRFEQFIFYSQWNELKSYARDNDINLFGDLPIYVSLDSVDVWANQSIFTLDPQSGKPTHVAGVPPDYFSKTGQRWGNPLYQWLAEDEIVQDQLMSWWTKRFAHLFSLVDTARIDHFRGFESYWAIPEENDTAINGKWLKGPGADFFHRLYEQLGPLDIIAEDLGIITKEVENLRDELELAGMKVLQFAFDGNPNNAFLPWNYTDSNCIVYTGTHDNDTTIGWYLSDKLTEGDRARIKLSCNRHPEDMGDIHLDFIHLAHSSISRLCIFPLQDILGFGSDCRMNSPGVPEGNWTWRCSEEFLTPKIAEYLKKSTLLFNRGKNQQTIA